MAIKFIRPQTNYVLIEYDNQCVGSIKMNGSNWILTLDGVAYLPSSAREQILKKMKELESGTK